MKKEALLELAKTADSESRNLDFKREFDPNSAVSWCDLIKDVVAMTNTDGGIIIFGINDDGSNTNFDGNTILGIDPAVITSKLESFIGIDFDGFEVLEVRRGQQDKAAIYIEPSRTPVVFKRNGAEKLEGTKHKPVFYKGGVYFRRGAKSEPGDSDNLRRSFERAINAVRKEWFEGMRQVSEAGPEDVVRVVVGKKNAVSGALSGMIRLSATGKPVKFTNEHVKELKELFPLLYKDVLVGCKNKKKTKQADLQAYINKCKNDQTLALNWKTIGNNLDLPTALPDKFTYSRKVVSDY